MLALEYFLMAFTMRSIKKCVHCRWEIPRNVYFCERFRVSAQLTDLEGVLALKYHKTWAPHWQVKVDTAL